MSRFKLFEQLLNPPNAAPTVVTSIKYQAYEVTVGSATKIVQVPVRETEAFEQALLEAAPITEELLVSLLRTHRGIRG